MNLVTFDQDNIDATTNYDIVIGQNIALRMLYGHCQVTTTSGGGSRRFGYQVIEPVSSDVVTDGHSGANQSGGSTKDYALKQGIGRETAFVDDDIEVAIGIDTIIPEGWTLRFYVKNAIAGDTFSVHIACDKRTLSRF